MTYLQEQNRQPVLPSRSWTSRASRTAYCRPVTLKKAVPSAIVCCCRYRRRCSNCNEFLKRVSIKNMLVRDGRNMSYLRDPLPSFKPIYLPSGSPDESLLWSSQARLLLLPHTISIGSDFTSLSLSRCGGDGVRLSLSLNDVEMPLPFDPLLLLLLLLFDVMPGEKNRTYFIGENTRYIYRS